VARRREEAEYLVGQAENIVCKIFFSTVNLIRV
jgi:hypothetical protein